ncbi:MAG: cupin domain-containing protein [Syntrophobacteraceae bacterium]
MAKRIITEADILAAVARGEKTLAVHAGEDLVTPQALDTALASGVTVDWGQSDPRPGEIQSPSASTAPQKFAPPDTVRPTAAGPSTTPAGVSELAGQIVESLRGRIPTGVDSTQVERLVREVVAARMAAPARSDSKSSSTRGSGIVFIDSTRLLAENTSTAGIKDKAILADAFGHLGECKLAAGYLVWEKASMERVVEAPEVCVVIEGELHLTAGGETLIGKPGDMLYLPQGAKVIYSTPSRVKLACVGHQA